MGESTQKQIVDQSGRHIVDLMPYEGHGPDDPNGYYYRYADEQTVRWVSAGAFAVRFQTLEQWEASPSTNSPTPPGM